MAVACKALIFSLSGQRCIRKKRGNKTDGTSTLRRLIVAKQFYTHRNTTPHSRLSVICIPKSQAELERDFRLRVALFSVPPATPPPPRSSRSVDRSLARSLARAHIGYIRFFSRVQKLLGPSGARRLCRVRRTAERRRRNSKIRLGPGDKSCFGRSAINSKRFSSHEQAARVPRQLHAILIIELRR